MYEPWFLIEPRWFRQSICIRQGQTPSDQASYISGAMIMISSRLDISECEAEILTFSVLETTVDSAYASSQRLRSIG